MPNNINNAPLAAFGAQLLAARVQECLSQRALSQLTGVPQAHISKIEQGRVDIRLSSLVELARALDLELRLLPRKALPLVDGAVRAIDRDADDGAGARALATLAQEERTLEGARVAFPDITAVQKLLPTIREFKLLPFDAEKLKALQRALAPIEQLRLQLASGVPDTAKFARLAEQTNRGLRALRNAQFHAPQLDAVEASRPAYRLDDEDEDD